MTTPIKFFSFVQGERPVYRVSGEAGTVVARLVIVPDPDSGFLVMWPAYGVLLRTHFLKTEGGAVAHDLEVLENSTFKTRQVRHGIVLQDIEVLAGVETYRIHEALVTGLLSGFWLHQMNS